MTRPTNRTPEHIERAVFAAYREGDSATTLSKRFKIAPATVYRIVASIRQPPREQGIAERSITLEEGEYAVAHDGTVYIGPLVDVSHVTCNPKARDGLIACPYIPLCRQYVLSGQPVLCESPLPREVREYGVVGGSEGGNAPYHPEEKRMV